METTKAIFFDMDGTIADLYGVDGWLNSLISEHTKPYREARPLVDMRKLGAELKRLQRMGYYIGIISWLSKSGSDEYGERVADTKMRWLEKHLGSVRFDEINIVAYGTPKSEVVSRPYGILFDDEHQNRENWLGTAYDVHNILETLQALA